MNFIFCRILQGVYAKSLHFLNIVFSDFLLNKILIYMTLFLQKGICANRQHERYPGISYLFIKQFLRFFAILLVWIWIFDISKKKFPLCSKITTYGKNGSGGNIINFWASKIHFYYYEILFSLILVFMIDPGSRLLPP